MRATDASKKASPTASEGRFNLLISPQNLGQTTAAGQTDPGREPGMGGDSKGGQPVSPPIDFLGQKNRPVDVSKMRGEKRAAAIKQRRRVGHSGPSSTWIRFGTGAGADGARRMVALHPSLVEAE
jgi:hypothetical protein